MDKDINAIYKKYFEIIDSFFGSIKHHLGDDEGSHIDLGASMASYPLISDLILDAIADLDQEVEKFWNENLTKVFDYLGPQSSLKCLYSGDISPVILENFVKRSALYIDTIILPDPLYNLVLWQQQVVLDKKYYLNKLIRHVFNIWKLKDLIMADTANKIVAIVPINLQIVDPKNRKVLFENADKKFTEYVNRVFGQNLNSKEECFGFLDQYQDPKDILGIVKDINALPREFRTPEGLGNFMKVFSGSGKYVKEIPDTKGWNFPMYLNTQFIRVQEHRFFCENLQAEPIYDYELPWFFFNYEIGGLDMDAAIANALQKENFNWIGNSKIPLSAFKVLREEGKLDYMRNVLREGMTDLKAKNDEQLIETSKQLETNLKNAFDRQNSEIGSLQKEVAKIIKIEIPITTGGFLAGFIPYVSNVVSVLSAGRDIKNLFSTRKGLKDEIKSKENSFINLLMKSHEQK